MAITETQTGDSSASLIVRGDFNDDGLIDAADIDLLSSAIRNGSEDQIFDLDDNGLVEKSDMNMMIHDVLDTTFGDADLDGFIDAADLTRVNGNMFESGTGWALGDFNGDGFTDVSDFNLWNMNRFTARPTVILAGSTDIATANDDTVVATDSEKFNEEVPASSMLIDGDFNGDNITNDCLLYTSPSPRDATLSRMPSSA